MGALIQAGQALVAGTGPGQLNQYYGLADATQTTVTSASFANLCTPYVIPAGEAASPGTAYELSCAGFGTWGSTVQSLEFSTYLGSGFGSNPTVGAALFNASQAFTYSLTLKLTCSDGVDSWWGDLQGSLVNSTTTLLPGTSANNACPIAGCNTGVHLAAVSGGLTAVIQCKWSATTGGPTITNTKTTWRKVA